MVGEREGSIVCRKVENVMSHCLRLWERFELRREHYNRHLKEQEEELLRAEKELEERKQRMEEAEEKRRQEENKTSLLAGFDYSSAYHSSMTFFNKTEVIRLCTVQKTCFIYLLTHIHIVHLPTHSHTHTHHSLTCPFTHSHSSLICTLTHTHSPTHSLACHSLTHTTFLFLTLSLS